MINAAGVFFHLEELHSVTEGIRRCLADDGVFVVQFLYMRQIVRNLAFDQIYHEHLLYYNLETIEALLEPARLRLFDAYLSPIHGGSIIAFVTRRTRRGRGASGSQQMLAAEDRERSNSLETYRAFAAPSRGAEARELGLPGRRSGKRARRIFGIGAPVKGNTLLNYFGIGPERSSAWSRRTSCGAGCIRPGMHIPVRIESELTGAARRLLRSGLELPRRDPAPKPGLDRPWRRVLLPDPDREWTDHEHRDHRVPPAFSEPRLPRPCGGRASTTSSH